MLTRSQAAQLTNWQEDVPLLANIALGALDERARGPWQPGGGMSTPSQRARRRAKSLPNWRIVRDAESRAMPTELLEGLPGGQVVVLRGRHNPVGAGGG